MRHLSEEKLRAYQQFFGTLTTQNRLRIINELRHGPLSVQELSQKTGIEQSAVSHNLKRLKHCGFVTVQQQGKQRIYALNSKTISKLMDIIDEHMKKHCIKIVRGER
ncbi:ArsR family transcriptional regulator [Candidatus Woesearchaeota archaeon]|nr:MAG: ArsR family transcriptional regulator [Candidatus Woesearchaeota archaeon]